MSPARLVHAELSRGSLAERGDEAWRGALGVVGFAAPPPSAPGDLPLAICGTPPVDRAGEAWEVWAEAGTGRATAVRAADLRLRRGERFTFGVVSVDEERLRRAQGIGAAAALHAATDRAYRAIFAALEAGEHRHLARIWHYVPDINGVADGEERYRHFNAARRAAFERARQATAAAAPAATAVGSVGGHPFTVFFLASAEPPVTIENPRQVSAYDYPPRYGPVSPLFSRAGFVRDGDAAHLFVSGTASIVGHRTLHPGDPAAQTHEALVNLGIVVATANRVAGPGPRAFGALRVKAYLRRPGDLETVRAQIARHALPVESVRYLRADICRPDLLVEIEAHARA
jgi:enamine deaminase RidA (YjgF/YER057c/UK114 family)